MPENNENGSNWSVIKFDGKPIEKLIDVISSAVGTLYKPRAIRNEAEAEAKKMEIIANAEAKTNIIKLDNHFELLQRAKDRITIQEINRQVNIEEIVEKTIKFLPETVSEEEVAQDWRTRFFSKAQDISNEDMQEIWAKLLANEVSQPNSISLRTIDILSNL